MAERRPNSTIFFDHDCGFCQRSVAAMRALDWMGAFRFVPLQSEEARDFGLEESRDLSQMVLSRRGRRWGGWRAVKRIAIQLPLFSLAMALALGAALFWPASRVPVVGVLVLLAVAISPLGNPAGDALYRWIARNRHRFPGSTCSIDRRSGFR